VTKVEKLPPPVFRLIRKVPLDIGAADTREKRRERKIMVVFIMMVEDELGG